MKRLIVWPLADRDVRALLYVSRERFGTAARRSYEALIRRAYTLLRSDPACPGVLNGDTYQEGARLFHLRHARIRGMPPKQPRHIIIFTVDDTTLHVLRVLHESMDITQHLSDEQEDQ